MNKSIFCLTVLLIHIINIVSETTNLVKHMFTLSTASEFLLPSQILLVVIIGSTKSGSANIKFTTQAATLFLNLLKKIRFTIMAVVAIILKTKEIYTLFSILGIRVLAVCKIIREITSNIVLIVYTIRQYSIF
jgi:hypothetical protein